MGDFTRGHIGDYKATAEFAATHPGIQEGDELVFLPTNVDDEGDATGVVFMTDGTVRPVVVQANPPEAQAAQAEALNASERDELQQLRAAQSQAKAQETQATREATPTPEPTPEPTPKEEPAQDTGPSFTKNGASE